MFKKIIIICSLLIFSLGLNSKFVHAENYVKDSDLFSKEQIKMWEEEAIKNAEIKGVSFDKNVNPNDRGTYGGWTWRDGVICVTTSKVIGVIETGHAGLIAPAPDYYATIESNPEKGVHASFQSWDTKYPQYKSWQVGVLSTTEYEDHLAAKWASAQKGKVYNYKVYDKERTDAFYCSQLVWAAYLNATGVDLNTSSWGKIIHPYEFLDNDNTTIIYTTWTP